MPEPIEGGEFLTPMAGLAALSSLVLSTGDISASAPEVVRIVSRMLPDRPSVAMSVRRGDESHFAATADSPRVPSGEATRNERAMHRELLRSDAGSVGELYIWPEHLDEFDERASPLAALIAGHLGTLLSFRLELTDQARQTERLRDALTSRSSTDQAVGILMGQNRFDREQATEALRTRARDNGVDIATLAAEIIRSLTGTELGTIHFIDSTEMPGNRGRVQ